MNVLFFLFAIGHAKSAVSVEKREAQPDHHHGHVVGYVNHNHPVGPHKCKDRKEKQCHKIPHHAAHDDCEVIVDVTYIEECEHIVSTHCHEDHTKVHHESHVVGHDSHVVAHEHYGKRDADHHHHHHAYSHGPKCHDKVDNHCYKVPKDHSHKKCKTTVDTTTTEECADITTTLCEYDGVHKHKEAHILGHETYVQYGHPL